MTPKSFYEYNQNHDLVRICDSEGREKQNTYDKNHHIILSKEKIEEGKWRETTWEYDIKGR